MDAARTMPATFKVSRGRLMGGCQMGACQFFSQGCTIGCKCNEDNAQADFFKHLCNSTAKATVNDPSQRTFN
eukprot:gene22089-55552_t